MNDQGEETGAEKKEPGGRSGPSFTGGFPENLPEGNHPLLQRIGRPTLLLLSDIMALMLANGSAVIIRKQLGAAFDLPDYLQLLPLLILFPIAFATRRLYSIAAHSPAEELRELTLTTAGIYLLIGSLAFMSGDALAWSRGIFGMATILSLIMLPFLRSRTRALFSAKKWWRRPVVILGAGNTGATVAKQLRANLGQGLEPVAFLDDDPSLQGRTIEGVPVIGPIDRSASISRSLNIKHAIIAMPASGEKRLEELERAEEDIFANVTVIPPVIGLMGLWMETNHLGGVTGISVRRQLLMPIPQFLKRGLDLILAAIALLMLVPVMTLIAMAIKVTSTGPILYGQRRIGRRGQPLTVWKFRSMASNADEILQRHLAENPGLRDEWERDHKLRRDPRITAIGKLLRKTSLDELPQLWNVLIGEMSLVGPRPIVEDEIPRYGEQFDLYQRVRPGITGLWQISGRNETTYGERVALDEHYVRNWSPWLDLWILTHTLMVVLKGEGAY